MRLPRLTNIHTVELFLKGGAVVCKEFTDFSWKYNGNGVTSLKWKTADGSPFYIDLDSIASISVVSRRVRFRLRHAE